MADKIFTEEQYQLIVKTYNYEIDTNAWGLLDYTAMDKFSNKLIGDFDFQMSKEIMAIANPLTREWAHDQFVEKEKKYCWKSKKQFGGRFKVLVKSADGYPADSFYLYPIKWDAFTETEVREACYNPDMFDREEVE